MVTIELHLPDTIRPSSRSVRARRKTSPWQPDRRICAKRRARRKRYGHRRNAGHRFDGADASIVNAASLTKYRRLGGFCKHVRANFGSIDAGCFSDRCVSPGRACFTEYRISRVSERYPLTSEILAMREVSTCKIPLSVEFLTGTRHRRPI